MCSSKWSDQLAYCYLSRHEDLQKAFCQKAEGQPLLPWKCDFKQAKCHYKIDGKKEGREYSCKANSAISREYMNYCYLHLYRDVAESLCCAGADPMNLWTCDLPCAYKHYQEHGKKEGRYYGCTDDISFFHVLGEMPLHQVAMLYAHDAGTGYMGEFDHRRPWMECQCGDLGKQADCGVRGVDMRLGLKDGVVKCTTGGTTWNT